MVKTDDLRYKRTEAAIRSAFLGLVSETSIGSITASAVCRRAQISRNAFYLHYSGVQGLYGTLVEELVDDIRVESLASADKCSSTGRDDAFGASIMSALSRHEDVLRALLPADDGSLAKCLAEGIEEVFVEAALRFGAHGGSEEHRLRCAYAAWALVGMVTRWIASTSRPLEEAKPLFVQLSEGTDQQSSRYLIEGMRQG